MTMLSNFVSDAFANRRIAPIPSSNSRLTEESFDRAHFAARTIRSLGRYSAFIACGVFALVFALASPARLSAQTAGTISGHVADSTGAVIPAATVKLTNVGTNAVRTTVTTSSGDYTFPNVPPAVYKIEVTHVGFKTASNNNVQLQVQQSLRQDFTLAVGEVTQSVTVSSTNALLQVDNSTLGTVIENEAITQLPLNGENYLKLVGLSANANTLSPIQGQAGARLGGSRASQSISVGGQRIMFDHYTLDGINNSDVDFNSFVVQPSIDAIQEFKVQTGVYPAQFGYNATQVNVVMKSGSNQYHGTAFEFLRNNYADALGFDYGYPTPLPALLPFKYNDYGFVLGGPITIPKIINGKDRFFFMANDEWYSSIQTGAAFATLPTQAMMGGDFSQYTATNGGPVVPIYDPTTGVNGVGRTQFSCQGTPNVICKGLIDQTSAKILQQFYHAATTSAFTSNYRYPTQATDKHDGFNLRADYNQSQKLQWAFRFSDGSETSANANIAWAGGRQGSSIVTNFTQYMGSSTWTISPTVVNQATIGYTYFYNSLGTYSQGIDNDVAKIGIPGLSPGPPSQWGIPDFGFGTDRWTGIGDANDGPYVTSDPDWSVNDNINWVKGKHAIDLGFEYDRQSFNELGNQFSRGVFNFQPWATANFAAGSATPIGGAGLADFLLGDLHDTTYAVQVAQANYVRNVEAAYFDDNYKITPKLTITAGLRYELTPPWFNTLGQEFVPNLNNSPLYPTPNEPANVQPYWIRQGNCSDAYHGISVRWVDSSGNPVTPPPQCANGQFSNNMMETDYTNWAPRIGVSYSPTPSWVIRAGFGMYYNHDIANARFDLARNLAGRVTAYAGQAAGQYTGDPTITWANAANTGSSVANIPPPYTLAMQYDHKTSYSEVYLLDIQKQLGQNWSFEAGYLGTLSRNLYGFRDANWSIPPGLLGPSGYTSGGAPLTINQRKPYPDFGVIQLVHDIGYGDYNAFSLKVNKHYSSGLAVIGSYTWAKSLDDTSGIRTQQSALFPQNDLCVPCEYGGSDFDVRHRLVASVNYELPVGAGKLWAPPKGLDAVVGGWELDVIGTFQTGTPFSLLDVGNVSNTDNSSYDRPNVNPGVNPFMANKTLGSSGQWLNPAAFSPDQAGFLGNMRRNVLYGPGYEDYDMALHKYFNMPYNEHHQLQLRFETFNTLNHVNPNNPNGTQNITATFGRITSGQPARQLQLGAKYVF
jgi:hypothetical protein